MPKHKLTLIQPSPHIFKQTLHWWANIITTEPRRTQTGWHGASSFSLTENVWCEWDWESFTQGPIRPALDKWAPWLAVSPESTAFALCFTIQQSSVKKYRCAPQAFMKLKAFSISWPLGKVRTLIRWLCWGDSGNLRSIHTRVICNLGEIAWSVLHWLNL